MAYTCSMDCSVRVKKSGVSGYLHHLYRDLYGDYNHSNKNINKELTENNLSLVYDDELGELVHPANIDELKEKLFADVTAYENAGNTIRKDAVYLRPVMMELGNGFYEDMPDGVKGADGDDHTEIDYMYEWACKTWGKENIRGLVCHMDEVHDDIGQEIHPHVTFLVSSIREDGKGNLSMNQKHIINGKNHLKSLHKSFRSFMKDKGLDIQMENLPTSHPHYKDEEYKQWQDTKKEQDARSAKQKRNHKWLLAEKQKHDARERELQEQAEKNRRDAEQNAKDAEVLKEKITRYTELIERIKTKDEQRKLQALQRAREDERQAQRIIDTMYELGLPYEDSPPVSDDYNRSL